MSKVMNLHGWIDYDDAGAPEAGFNIVDSRCPKCYTDSSLIILHQKTVPTPQHFLGHRLLLQLKCICCDYKTTGEFNVK